MTDDPSTYFPDLHIEAINEVGGTSFTPVPAFNQEWMPLTKLRWCAAVERVRSGVLIRVDPAHTKRGRYWLSHRNLSWSDMNFHDAWRHINTFGSGYQRGKEDAS